jgi:hypothetical protein
MIVAMRHEEALIRAFILPNRVERYLECLKNPKKRTKFHQELHHFKALNPKYLVPILPRLQHADSIEELLKAKGAAQTCWMICGNRELDGREIELREALEETVGYGIGTLISCVPGKLGYFEDETVRGILER